MFSGISGLLRGTRDAKLATSALENLSGWAEREWMGKGSEAFGTTDLSDALSQLLADGAEHARTQKVLDRTTNPPIARAILLGVLRSGTHSRTQLESAIGVPFPHDDAGDQS